MTAKEEFQAFLDAQAIEGYVLGDITGTKDGDMEKYTELKIAVAQEEKKIEKFQADKQVAFDELALQHNDERIVLGQLWQAKEDAGYDVDFVPQ